MSPTPTTEPSREPHQIVGEAIQNLAAKRLGRGFLPLGALLLLGLGTLVTTGGRAAFALAVGAPVSAGAMLAFAQRVVRRAFGHPWERWMAWAAVAGLTPLGYGLWVMAWLGLRGLARAGGITDVLMAVVCAGLGVWTLRSWMRIVELQRLAEVMSVAAPGEREDPQ